MKASDIQQIVADLSAKKVHPIGQKIYRVLDNGDILMEKISGYEIQIDDKYRATVRHTAEGRYSKYAVTPEEHASHGYGSRVHSWHFDRQSANKAAAPLVKIQNQKRIQQNRNRIAELEQEIKGMEDQNVS